MIVSEPLLSICVPTYNRHQSLHRQLSFLKSEVNGAANVEVIVSDNCSIDDTPTVMKDFQGIFQLHRNECNVGLVGNLNVLMGTAAGRYLWFVGDDDELHTGILGAVLRHLASAPEFVYLNHRIADNSSRKVLYQSLLPSGPDLYKDGKDCIKAIASASLAQAILISASIYKRSNLLELTSADPSDLATPLRYAFFCCSKGAAAICREVVLTNYWGDTSWDDRAYEFKFRWIPGVVKELPELGYGRLYSYQLLFSWYRRLWREYVQHQSPWAWKTMQKVKRCVFGFK